MPQERKRNGGTRAPALPGLRYSLDTEPGIRRIAGRKGFEYRDAAGARVTDARTRERIKLLAIPPAWTDVWICRDDRGHLQATGRDARGRKQYRYHARWREMRDADKFDHLAEFAAALPAIRRRSRADMALPGLPRRKVLGAIVQLLETTCFRIGNERYAEENDSFGLTTLRNRHVKVAGSRVEFQFRGKSGKFHKTSVDDERLARIIRRCRDLPGQALFEYLDEEGQAQAIGSGDVNEYLKEIAGADVTAKDFRTWAGTVFVANELSRREGPVGPSHMVAAVRQAALRLGNTPAICRKSYVHPRLLDPRTWERRASVRRQARRRGLRADEAALLALLTPLREASRTPRLRRSSPPASRPSAPGPT
ncbi:MAG TPA: DNA topoisomerase IB [Usitatibacter sp.]|nr:DNA topoisomerase IB [Usitatibacter sp.]